MVIDSEIVGDVEDPRGSAHDISKSEGALLSKLMSGIILFLCSKF